ncbi:MAG: sulfotransferase [Gammaproteobacteria bacterium]|nr:sulfotransferase [Gammaproteobacteria bacterium]
MVKDEHSALKASFERALEFLNAGDHVMAEKICRKTIKEVSNSDPNIQVLLAVSLIRQGRSGSAVKRLKHTLRAFPDFPPAHEELGNALLAQNKPENAIEAFKKVLELKPDNASAMIKLGKIFKQLGRKDEANEFYQSALSLEPTKERLATAAQAFAKGETEKAEKITREVLREHPEDVDGLRLLASIANNLEQRADAIVLLEKAVQIKPRFAGAWADLAETYTESEDFGKALDAVQRVIKLQPNLPFGHMIRGSILGKMDDHKGSIESYENALKIEPQHIGSNMGLGNILKTIGRYDDAVVAYKNCIDAQPMFSEAYWSLANLKTYNFEESEIEKMEEHIQNPDLPPPNKAFFHIALANAKEKQKKYGEAWYHFFTGNELRRQSEIYDSVTTQVTHETLMETFTKDFVASTKGKGCESEAPIFILGLPRSGSTLIEQILASHSQVEGTRELPDISLLGRKLTKMKPPGIKYPDAVKHMTDEEKIDFGEDYLKTSMRYRTDKPHFIDKMPNNFAHIGFIKTILPNAKIINAKRHPLDSCVSSFKQLFYKGQSWSYDLFEIGEYYLEYERLMKHWHEVYPNDIYDIQYEKLIEDQEEETKKLIDYCGLDWEEECLKFYENKRSVNTASSEQVRQPIYKGAMFAWKNYESELGPLIEILDPVLKDLPKD